MNDGIILDSINENRHRASSASRVPPIFYGRANDDVMRIFASAEIGTARPTSAGMMMALK